MIAVNNQNVTINNRYETTADGDWALVKLIDQANNVGLEVGMLLNLGGILISGTLVGGAKYFEAMQQQIAALGEADVALRGILEEIARGGHHAYKHPPCRIKVETHRHTSI